MIQVLLHYMFFPKRVVPHLHSEGNKIGKYGREKKNKNASSYARNLKANSSQFPRSLYIALSVLPREFYIPLINARSPAVSA